MKLRAFFAAWILFASLSLGTPSWADTPHSPYPQLTPEQKLSDLSQVSAIIRAHYGPLRYKETLGIRLDDLESKYRDLVLATRSNSEFYYLLVRYVAEFKDSHFSTWLPTNYIAQLPIATDLVEGKLVIDTIDRSVLPESTFPFQKGDEIVTLDNETATQFLDRTQGLASAGYSATARRRAATLASYRPASRVPVTGSQKARLQIRRGSSAILDEASLDWKASGTVLDELSEELNSDITRSSKILRFEGRDRLDRLSLVEDWAELEKGRFERSFRCSGQTRWTIPADATVLMTKPVVAYYHPTARGNIGYLRIPEYSAINPDTGASEYDVRFAQYEWLISQLEQNTVGLVIDQDHNCGGSVAFLHRVLSLFMDRPVQQMQFSLLANKGEYQEFKSWLDWLTAMGFEHSLEYDALEPVVESIRQAWQRGDYLTPLTAIEGNRLVHPNTVRYTKPVVMTIDEMSGSGGDAFPALMQGYGRAKLIGTRTMGAGGHVVEMPPLYFSRMNLRITKSLFYRPDGVPVENNGAVPDHPYSITLDDFKYGYRDYHAFAISKLFEILP